MTKFLDGEVVNNGALAIPRKLALGLSFERVGMAGFAENLPDQSILPTKIFKDHVDQTVSCKTF
ncbi:hypothetical protein GGD83_003528 [Rhodoblastus sphagnicola]|uniref:hypothetical protein n=1 Tax=Rhodoblastus sphagnicola TaxID=333368 RepID=UPI0011AFF232|nr:hypothetical protein [Rhodoblastus sphagnicola]MBB4199707.1 hypothetical protein [Rhodoblastus sphagnicola]